MFNIAVLGHGVVGSGVVEIIHSSQSKMAENLGDTLTIKRILDLRDFDVPYADKFTKNYDDILQDEEIRLVVEVLGGLHPAYEFVKSALLAGKSVVTSNKELVAAKGAELLEIAKANHVNFFFEASVGGGIPIIRPLHRCLAANQVQEIRGILNGTTNFILTKMIKEHMAFDDALHLAQQLGYAERDPSADIEGHDACRKICILASLAFGTHIYPEDVYTQGISDITLEDVAYAESDHAAIKLIGRTKMLEDGQILCMVTPAWIDKNTQLGNIQDVFNGIEVIGDYVGSVVFYGPGAGKLPTASAVVGDVLEALKLDDTCASLTWKDDKKHTVCPYQEIEDRFYLRVEGDASSLKAQIEEAFGAVTFLSREGQPENEVAFLTKAMTQSCLDQILAGTSEAWKVLNQIRVLKGE